MHIEVVFIIQLSAIHQANETSCSQQIELEGCKESFVILKQFGLTVSVFMSDRHKGIGEWIRESRTKHYFDSWHVARSLTKKLLKGSKGKRC